MKVSIGTRDGIALKGFPLDHHSSFLRGTAGGPPLIRESLYSEAINLWTENGFNLEEPLLFRDLGDVSFPDRQRAFRTVEQTIEDIAEMNLIPLSLGGDHSITFPIIRPCAGCSPKWPYFSWMPIQTCIMNSRAIPTHMPAPLPGSWRKNWPIP